jgi:hypothetical protein
MSGSSFASRFNHSSNTVYEDRLSHSVIFYNTSNSSSSSNNNNNNNNNDDDEFV